MIDLHTHSSASDGTFTPSELIKYAASKNISTIALTDHDTVQGLEEAQKEACIQGINFIPGIELSINWPTGEFHLLGLGLKTVSPELNSIINFICQERDNRNRKMAEKLQQQGVPISYEEITQKFNAKNLGRPHFAEFMVQKGIVKNRQQAFDRYFARGRPCYVDRVSADLDLAVKAIKSSGGIPIQAHPLSMYVSWGKLEDTIIRIQNEGVQGLEAWHPGVRVSEAERLEKIADNLEMTVTAGSDFHGEKIRADRKIGYTAGKNKIPDKYWEENLKPALEKIHHGTDHSFKA